MHSEALWIALFTLACISLSHGQKDGVHLVFRGRLLVKEIFPTTSIDDDQFKMLKEKVIDVIEIETTIDRGCFMLTVSFSKDPSTSWTLADYSLGVDMSDCKVGESFVISNISETLGINSLIVKQYPVRYPGSFWKDPMNSILVFAGCGAVILIISVMCTVVLCRQNNRKPTHNSSSLSSTNKLMSFQAYEQTTPARPTYAGDALVMDVPRQKSAVVSGSATIERWVHSELSKSRVKKDANQLSGCSQNVMTIDSGIVAMSPRKERTKEHPDDDNIDTSQPQLSHFNKIDSQTALVMSESTSANALSETTEPAFAENPAYLTEADPTRFTE